MTSPSFVELIILYFGRRLAGDDTFVFFGDVALCVLGGVGGGGDREDDWLDPERRGWLSIELSRGERELGLFKGQAGNETEVERDERDDWVLILVELERIPDGGDEILGDLAACLR